MRMRPRILIGVFLVAAVRVMAAAPATGRIVVSADHHFLQYGDGRPFFWLADTAWLLFAKLDRADTEMYLDDRQKKGFDVVQAVLLHGADELNPKNPAGGIDPAKPDRNANGYWDHVDWVVDQAAKRGIYMAMVPAWGSLVNTGQLNTRNAAAYARFLANRYKSRSNILWILGGDIRGDRNGEVWQIMGRTLKAEDPRHLITFHPFGRTQSSMWFQNAPWLDFNMFQSGHRRYDQDTDSPHRYGEDNWRYVRDDYSKLPLKPVLDGEPSYEGIPQGLHDTSQPYWTAADCRRYAYWSVFAGAFGHTYGDNAVMQFYRPGIDRGAYGPKESWIRALRDPGAGEMQYLKRLMLSRPYFERVPDQSAIAGRNGTRYNYVIATRGASYLFAYTYTGRPFAIRMGAITGSRVRAWWYDPRDGSARAIGTFANRGTRRFTPPGKPANGNDWVLVLDDASRHFSAAGAGTWTPANSPGAS
jgi:Protein of unknown function (DUF4038)/Putative collagen-binding domain of a collagenase